MENSKKGLSGNDGSKKINVVRVVVIALLAVAAYVSSVYLGVDFRELFNQFINLFKF